MSAFCRLDITGIEPELSAPAPERLLAGDPQFRSWNVEDSGDGVHAGVWESTPGHWRIEYTEWECCEILSGVSRVHEDGGASHELVAGDRFILRPGFRGSWEVLQTTRKVYVIRA